MNQNNKEDSKKVMYVCEDTHDNMDFSIIEILNSIDWIDLYVFCSKEKQNRLSKVVNNPEAIVFYKKKFSPIKENASKKERLTYFFKRYKDIVAFKKTEKIDFIFFATMQQIFLNIFFMFRNYDFIFMIHNINHWYFTRKAKRDYKEYIESNNIKYQVQNSVILKKAKGVLFLTEYLEKKANSFVKKDSFVIPFYINGKNKSGKKLQIEETAEVYFTVLGNVDNKRRNYFKIIDHFSQIKQDNFKLVFLGKTNKNSKEILDYANRKIPGKVIYFEGYIPNDVYEQYLYSSHFCIMELNLKSLPYGIYKASATEFEAPANGIPVLVNNKYPSKIENSYALYYEEEEMYLLLERLMTDCNEQKYNRLYRQPALDYMRYYDFDFQKKRLEKYLNKIIRGGK